MTIELLMMGPLGPIERAVEPDFVLHRLWKEPEPAAFLARVGPAIRGAITFTGAPATDRAVLDALPSIEIITNMGAGYESIDVDSCKARGIIVTNAGSVNAVDVAENAFGLILATARGIVSGDRYARAGRWAREGRLPMTHRLAGRRVGIVGLGAIGLEIARRAEAFGMIVAYCNRKRRGDVGYAYVADPVVLARESDFLVLATPGGPATNRLIGREALDALGPDGILINIARGSVVDEAALIAALAEGRLGGAGLDVFENEPEIPEALLGMTNVVLEPHQAGATYEGVGAAIEVVIRNLRSHFAGGAVEHRVA